MLYTAIAPQLFTIAFEQRGKKNWIKSCTLAVVPETIIRSVVIFKEKKVTPQLICYWLLSSIFRFQDLVSHSFALNLATGHLGNAPCFGDFLLQHIQQCGHVTSKECEKHHTKSQHLQNEFNNNTSTNQNDCF